jgi:hypothetical protein
MTGVHVYDPSHSITYRHTAPLTTPDDIPGQDDTVLAIIDRLTGEYVYTLPARALRIGGLILAEIPPMMTLGGAPLHYIPDA